MIRRQGKKIVSILLALFVVFSYLGFMPKDVAAAEALGSTIKTNTVYSTTSVKYKQTPSGYSFITKFTPAESGYYLTESDRYLSFVKDSNGKFEYVFALNGVALDVPYLVENHQSRYIYELVAGTTYYLTDEGGYEGSTLEFSVRKVDKLFFADAVEENLKGYKGGTVLCQTNSYSTVPVDNITFEWHQNGVKLLDGYKNTEANIKFNDLLDTNGKLPEHDMKFIPEGDIGSTYISCLIQFSYKEVWYYVYVDFYIAGYSSELESTVTAESNSSGYSVNYHNTYGFDYPVCTITTSAPQGSTVSYQWYKINTSNQDIEQVYKNESLYQALPGETSNELWINEDFMAKLGEPTFVLDDNNQAYLFTHLVCVVTVKKGTATVKRYIPYEIEHTIGVYVNFEDEVIVKNIGDTVKLPNAAANYYNSGSFNITEKPDYLSYKFTWYDCTTIPGSFGYTVLGDADNSYSDLDFVKGLTKLGTGKSFNVDTSKLTVFEESTGKVSYVAVKIQPVYNGKVVKSACMAHGIIVFKIYYSSLKINTQPENYCGPIGDYATFSVKAEGEGLKYQWQYLNKNYNWVNSNTTGADTSEMSIKITSGRDGQLYRCIVTDKNGVKTVSETVCLYVGKKLEILSDPVNYTGKIGSTAEFTVKAKGEDISYQWYYLKDGVWKKSSSDGCYTDTLSIKVTETREGQQYKCVVTDYYGKKVESAPASIHIGKGMSVIYQPVDYTGPVGTIAYFEFDVDGEGLTYQWYYLKDGVWKKSNSTGCNEDLITIKITEARNNQQYKCIVTDKNGSTLTSDVVTLRVGNPLYINNQPKDYVGPVGSYAVFNVVAEGDELTYQWYYLKDGVWKKSNTTGFDTDTLKIKVTEARNEQMYKCVVSDSHGTVRETDIVWIQIGTQLEITSNPSDFTGKIGSTATFNVAAKGDGLTYQWYYYNGGGEWKKSSADGAKTNSLSIKVTESRDGQQYQCIILDDHGQRAYSTIATLNVAKADAITITDQPKNCYGAVGDYANMSVSATGEGLTYQWQYSKDGGNTWKNSSSEGATSSAMSIQITQARYGQCYRCKITDAYGVSVYTDTATIYSDQWEH